MCNYEYLLKKEIAKQDDMTDYNWNYFLRVYKVLLRGIHDTNRGQKAKGNEK